MVLRLDDDIILDKQYIEKFCPESVVNQLELLQGILNNIRS